MGTPVDIKIVAKPNPLQWFTTCEELFLAADAHKNSLTIGFSRGTLPQRQLSDALEAWNRARLEFESAAKMLAAVEFTGPTNVDLAAAELIANCDTICTLQAHRAALIPAADLVRQIEAWKLAKANLMRATGKGKGASRV